MEKFLSLDSPLDRIQFMYRQEAYLPMLQVQCRFLSLGLLCSG